MLASYLSMRNNFKVAFYDNYFIRHIAQQKAICLILLYSMSV